MSTDIVDKATGEIKDGVVVPEVALSKKTTMSDMVKPQEIPLMEMMSELANLDWRELKPHQTALLLMQKPFMAQGGGTMYLSFKQSILFATRCYELGVSPFSSEVWFDPNRASVNLTLEGKRQVARNKGIDLGPPKFEELEREWDKLPKVSETATAVKAAGFTRDVGIKCKIRVGDPKHQEYTEYIAWLSEWYVSRSPVWQSKPLHMLQTRACEKAISMALGTGASDFPAEE
jgi:hypothetical protein